MKIEIKIEDRIFRPTGHGFNNFVSIKTDKNPLGKEAIFGTERMATKQDIKIFIEKALKQIEI